MPDREIEIQKLNASIAALEAQRATLGDAVVDPAISALRQQLSQLDAGAEKSAPEDERKLVTIVFADISGFTALSEKKDPEEVREMMNTCFQSLVPIVQKYEGTIDKFIGDEIMALFGAPIAHEDDPERALHAALEMMDAIAAVNRQHATDLGIHIGINSGPVIAGQIGAENRRDYSVMGDAVNLAARLEDASSRGEIFVGPATYQQTVHAFEFEKIPPLTLKGKEAPVQVHRLLRAKATAKSRRGIAGLRTELVGRDSELVQIKGALGSLKSGRGSIVAILGEAGVGKSRLISEARAAAQDYRWAEGRALSYTAGMSYWLSRAVLYDLFEIEPDTEPLEAASALRTVIERELPGKFAEVYPYLARLFELPLDEQTQERVKFLSTEALQTRILQAVQDYVRACAKHRPLILIWEDMHWSDPSSLEVFESLVPLVKEVPLFLICIARPDENPATDLLERVARDHGPTFHKIELSPLTREQSRSLFEQLLKIDNQQTRDLILDRADGNPFFLEELVRSLIDAGALTTENNRLVATREINALDVPETLQSTLMTRIDRLRSPAKLTLQRASIIGRVFQQSVLARLDREKISTLNEELGELLRREFVRMNEDVDQADREYLFKHAITHDVAYNSMLVARRKELHKRVAGTLEEIFPERLEELAPVLGYHYERAGQAAPAVRHLGRAAERAQAMFANDEALAFYRAAIAQTGSLDSNDEEVRQTTAKLLEGAADVLTLLGRHDEARTSLARAHDLAPAAERAWRARLYRKIGFTYNLQRRYAQAEEAYATADDALGPIEQMPADASVEKAQIALDRMQLLYWQGRAEEMLVMAREFQDTIQRSGQPMQRARYFQMLGLSRLTASRYRPDEECIEQFKRALAESEGTNNLSEESHIRFTVGLARIFHGDFDEAIVDCEAALHLAERCGDLVMQARCANYLAVAHRRAHHLEPARALAHRTLELAGKIGMLEYLGMAKTNLAWCAWRDSNHDDAEKIGAEALELWHGMEDPYSFDWMALLPMSAAALDRGQLESAIKLLRGVFPQNQHPINEKLMTELQQAIDLWDRNDQTAAGAQLKIALQTAEQYGYI